MSKIDQIALICLQETIVRSSYDVRCSYEMFDGIYGSQKVTYQKVYFEDLRTKGLIVKA